MQRLFFLLLVLSGLSTGMLAQKSNSSALSADRLATLQSLEDELLTESYQMHTDSSEQARFVSCKRLIKGLVRALQTPGSYYYDFPNLAGVKIVRSPDDKFRIFTWELHVDRETYRHYGAIQHNSIELKLTPLVDRGYDFRQNPETVITSNKDWLGYVAYGMIPGGTHEGQPYYFVLGYDRYSGLRRQKFLDVLTFDAAGKPQFGLPIFVTYTPEGHLLEDRARILLEYSAEASVALQYDPKLGRIVYENLIIAQGSDEGPLSVPDGSYHALELGTDGRWHEVTKLFDHKYEKAPVERVTTTGNVDIIGRSRN